MSSRYESLVVDSIPPGCARALDVGCGNGDLSRELRRRGVPEVTGIDADSGCIARCRTHPDAGDISYLSGDVLTTPLASGSFDLVSAVASLHHMDARAGLLRLRNLVAPGGVLIVIGLAKAEFPKDIPIELAALTVNRLRRRPKAPGDGTAGPPLVWPPPERYSTMYRLGAELLPGVSWRRHLMWRYSLVWTNQP